MPLALSSRPNNNRREVKRVKYLISLMVRLERELPRIGIPLAQIPWAFAVKRIRSLNQRQSAPTWRWHVLL
jgi:hypothetical protein